MSMEVTSHNPKRRARALTLAMSIPYMEPQYKEKMPPTVIAVSLYFKGSLPLAELRATIKERFVNIERFRTVLKQDGSGTVWLETLPTDDIDMEYHVPDITNGKMWTQQDINDHLGSLYSQNTSAFDMSRPLWRWEVIQNVEGDRSLLISVVDHTVCDGISYATMLQVVLDPLAEKPPAEKPVGDKKTSKKKVAAGPGLTIARCLWGFSVGTIAAVLGPVLPGDPPHKLKEKDHRNPCTGKSCALGVGFPLQRFKDVKDKIPGATINDVMLATLTLMLKRYFAEVGEKTLSVSANFPINMRPPRENVLKKSMGNNFFPAVFSFPMKEKDPVKVLWGVKNQIDMIKNSLAPLILHKLVAGTVVLLNKLRLRKALVDASLDSFGKVSVMLSNVPGPAVQRHLCNVPIVDLSFYTFTPLGVYLGVCSYADQVSVGVVTGTDSEPNAQNLAKHWAPAFEELENSVNNSKPSQLKKPADWLGTKVCMVLVPIVALVVSKTCDVSSIPKIFGF